jgi:hypothetical protein
MESLFRGLPDPSERDFQKLVEFSEDNAGRILPLLPAFTSLIASRLSFTAAYTISYNFSGKRIYLAKSKEAFERKIQCKLDEDTYEQILDIAFAEPHIEIPSAWGVFTVIRKIVILDYLEQTQSKVQARIEFGSNRRFIDKLWNDQKVMGEPYPFLLAEQKGSKNTTDRSGGSIEHPSTIK